MKSLLILAAALAVFALVPIGCAPEATADDTTKASTGTTGEDEGPMEETGTDDDEDEDDGPVGADDEKVEGEPKTADTTAMATPPAKVEMKPVAFTNDKGELVCPVMKSVIASESSSVGFQDFEGKRYYFCCDGCPQVFKKDPAKWAKK
jgi:YHS domain-containing protein